MIYRSCHTDSHSQVRGRNGHRPRVGRANAERDAGLDPAGPGPRRQRPGRDGPGSPDWRDLGRPADGVHGPHRMARFWSAHPDAISKRRRASQLGCESASIRSTRISPPQSPTRDPPVPCPRDRGWRLAVDRCLPPDRAPRGLRAHPRSGVPAEPGAQAQ